MRRRMVSTMTVTFVAAAAALVGTGSAAYAATTVFCSQPANPSGDACFYSTGDKFAIQDIRPDGMRAVVIWNTDYGRSGECTDANGAQNGWVWCDYDLAEGHSLRFVVVARDGANGANQWPSPVAYAWTSGR
jgi:hypothetical protein